MELLLKKSTTGMNVVNKDGRTSLHVAVCKQHVDCVRVLLNYHCDVNLQVRILFTARYYAFAVLAMGLCLSVCLSVRLSQVGVLLKRLNVGSHKQHHTIAQEL